VPVGALVARNALQGQPPAETRNEPLPAVAPKPDRTTPVLVAGIAVRELLVNAAPRTLADWAEPMLDPP